MAIKIALYGLFFLISFNCIAIDKKNDQKAFIRDVVGDFVTCDDGHFMHGACYEAIKSGCLECARVVKDPDLEIPIQSLRLDLNNKAQSNCAVCAKTLCPALLGLNLTGTSHPASRSSSPLPILTSRTYLDFHGKVLEVVKKEGSRDSGDGVKRLLSKLARARKSGAKV